MAEGITLRDIATQAGVSISTVSLVLNQRANVADKTAEHVRAVMRELGYRGRSRVGSRRLANGRARRTNRVALVLLGAPRVLLANSVYADVVAGVESVLRKHGLTMVLICATNPATFAAEVAKYSVDGLLLLGDTSHPAVAGRVWRYPCVRIMGAVQDEASFDQVLVDNASVAKVAANYVIQAGHKVCASIGRGEGVFRERLEMYGRAVDAGGAKIVSFVDPRIIQADAKSHIILHDRLDALIDQLVACDPRPTSLLVESDNLVTSVYQALLRRGIHPGTDIEVLSVNNERHVLANLSPAPVAIDIHATAIGKRAVDQLIWRFDHPDAPKVVISFEAQVASPAAPLEITTSSQVDSTTNLVNSAGAGRPLSEESLS